MREVRRFTHCGIEYTVCTRECPTRVEVMVMRGSERADNRIYSVELEDIGDALSTPLRPDLAEELAEIALTDFCQRRSAL
jgi:hypothetical protein